MEHRGLVLLPGTSHPDLAAAIAKHLDVGLGDCSVYHNTNRETMVEIRESVRGKDVYIIQTGAKDVNNAVMELLIAAYACKTSSANRITAVMPYLPYSKQSKMHRRGNISLKLVAQMLVKAGFDHIISVDMHSKESLGFFDCNIDNLRSSPFLIEYIQTNKEIHGFFDVPVENMRASPFLMNYIRSSIPDYRNAVIVARTPLAVRRATSYAERLRLAIAVIHGEVKPGDNDDDGRASPPPALDSTWSSRRVTSVGISLPPLTAKEKPAINVVGDVGGKIAIMVDDMVDEVQAFVDAAFLLKERGAYKIYVMATHGLFSMDAPRLIEESCIDEVVVTNTIPQDWQKLQCQKIKTVDISILLAEAIRRIHNKESMSHLFKNVTLED